MLKVLTIGRNGGVAAYSSLRSASRALSGNGTDSVRGSITRRCDTGGGFVNGVWVQYTTIPSIRRPII